MVALRRWRSPMTGGAVVEFIWWSNSCHGSTWMNANTAKHVRCPAWLRHPAMRHPCRSVLIRGQRRIPPGARQRPPWSWSGGWAGFDRVEQHPGDVEPELRIQLADARRGGEVDLGEVVGIGRATVWTPVTNS